MSDALPVVGSHVAAGNGWVLERGRDARTGAPRLVLTLADRRLADVRQSLAVGGSVGMRHLAEVVDAQALPDGSVAVVCAPPGGPSLAEVLRRRGALSAGEVVTIVAPLASTLAGLHSRGLSLATVTEDTLWLTSDGRPVLLPVGIGGCEDAHDQLAALADLATSWLDRTSANATTVLGVLSRAAAGELDAAHLSTALLRVAEAAPIAVRQSKPVEARTARRRRRNRSVQNRMLSVVSLRRVQPVLAIAAVALAAIGLGGLWGRHAEGGAVLAATPPTSRPTVHASRAVSEAPSWASVMTQLERRRARAYTSGDVTLLDDVYAPSSPTGESDRLALARMSRGDRRVQGFRAYVEAVVVIATTDNRTTLRVTDALTSYDVIGPNGDVLRRGTGRPSREWRVVLVKSADRWRIWSVSPTR
jgi:eukaryotic-like serine/threonine-protein kinase